MIKEHILAQVAANTEIPTPPALILQIVEKTSQPNCALEEVGDIIRCDPALCGKLLKMINSALFCLPRAVTSIDRALSLLGLKQIRSMVLSLSLPALHQGPTTDADSIDFWKISVAGAIVARQLSVKLGHIEPEDDLVAGLLRDIGLLVLRRWHPEIYETIRDPTAEEPWSGEHHESHNHGEVSAAVLRRWGLPPEITEPVRLHLCPERVSTSNPVIAARTRVLHFAGLIALLQRPNASPALARRCIELARDWFAMDEGALAAFLSPLHWKMEHFASLVQVEIGRCDSYPTLLSRAIEELIRCMEAEESATSEQRDAPVVDSPATQEWKRVALGLLRHTPRDAITGIPHRMFFDQALGRAFRRCRRRCTCLGVVRVKLHDFRGIIQRAGHRFGDWMLGELAHKIVRSVRQGDLVARYAAEEFSVLVTDTTESGLTIMSRRLKQTLQGLRLTRLKQRETVDVSVSAVLFFPRGQASETSRAAELLEQAWAEFPTSRTDELAVRSFVTEADRKLLAAIQRRRLGVFLVEKGLASEAQIREASRWLRRTPPMIGRLARELRWLRPRQLRRLLRCQRSNDLGFDEAALKLRLLSQQQIFALLAMQAERSPDLAASLVDQGVISADELQPILEHYYRDVVAME